MKPNSETLATPFSWPVRVYWEDTDAGGIVFYANYLKFFERARTEWLRALGLEQSLLRQAHGGIFVVSEAHIQYLRSAKLDDMLNVTAQLGDCGRSSFTVVQEAVLQGDTPTPLCKGSVRVGWVDQHTFKPIRIPSDVLDLLNR